MTANLTPADLDRLDALEKAATPGPWQYLGPAHILLDGTVEGIPTRLGRVDADGADFLLALRNSYAALAAEIRRLWAELAAIDATIGDRGVPERDCTLPLPERVDNIIVELKNWRHDYGTEAMENEKLHAENERLRDASTRVDEEGTIPTIVELTTENQRLSSENERLRAVRDAAAAFVRGVNEHEVMDVRSLEDALDAARGGA